MSCKESISETASDHLTRVSKADNSDADLDVTLLLVGKPLVGVVEEGENRLVRFGVLPRDNKFPDIMMYLEAVDPHAQVDVYCMPHHRLSADDLPDRMSANWKSTKEGEVFISSKSIAYEEAVDERMRNGEKIKVAAFGCAIRGMSGGSSKFQLTLRLSFNERKLHPDHEAAMREIHKACCSEKVHCRRWMQNEMTTNEEANDDKVEFDFCHRAGSICDSNGYLIRLDMRSYGLKCKLPTRSLCKLKTLEALDLSHNDIHADISEDMAKLGDLKNLKDITMEHDLIFGELSTDGLCTKLLKNLRTFNLDHNYISGRLPPCLFTENASLEEIYLSLNQFSGSIPDVIPATSSLKALTLSGNRLSGALPASLGKLKMLKALYLDGNSFNGQIPDTFAGLESLEILDLSKNRLSGFPRSWSTSWEPPKRLRVVKLHGNKLRGRLPTRLVRANSLEWLDISKNLLTGKLFARQGMLPNLMHFNLSRNTLTGPIPDEFSSMGLFGNEKRSGPSHVFDVSFNNLSGAIPSFMYQENNPNIMETDVYLEGNNFTCHPWRTLNYIPNFECRKHQGGSENDGTETDFLQSERNQRDLISESGRTESVRTSSVNGDGSLQLQSSEESSDDNSAHTSIGVIGGVVGAVMLAGLIALLVKLKLARDRRLGRRYGPADDLASDDGMEGNAQSINPETPEKPSDKSPIELEEP